MFIIDKYEYINSMNTSIAIWALYISFVLSGMYYGCDMSHIKFLGEK